MDPTNYEKPCLTGKELERARQALAQRNELTRLDGFESKSCDPLFASDYNLGGRRGRQIYRSYSDEELLDILITVMDHPGHSPHFDRLHHIYKMYLSKRFDNLAEAKAKARSRQKALAQQAKWPPDWPTRVSPQPLYDWVRERGKELSSEDIEHIERLCEATRKSKLPPSLSSPEVLYLSKFCSFKKALELMNIPALRKNDLRYMLRYWNQHANPQSPSDIKK